MQSYDLRIPVSHFDLYRLGDPSELTELGFDEALQNGICLVEWPEMAAGELPAERITLTLAHEGNGRRATIAAAGAQASRIRRVLAIRNFLDDAGYPDAKRRFLTGDASLRAYEAIHHEKVKRRIILMDWRPHPEGPPVYDGKPYPRSRIWHRMPIPSLRLPMHCANGVLPRRRSLRSIIPRASC